MQNTKIIVIICAAALLLRIILAAQSPTLDYDAYSTVRQVEHIKDTALPLLQDPLAPHASAGVTFPLFAYIIAFSTLLLPDDIAYLIVPNLIAVLLHAALYYLILELTNSRNLSIIGATASIFIPSYLSATLLTLSSLSLAIPLLVVFLTLFLKLRKTKENRNVLLFVFALLAFTHPIALLCIPFLIISVILATIRRSRDETIQLEFALFAIFFLLWLYILLYRESLATIGLHTLFGNLPSDAIDVAYGSVSLTLLAVAIGIIPFGLALYAAYREGLAHHIGIQATLALAISIVLVMTLKIIPLTTGLAVFSVVCVALACVGLQHLHNARKAFKKQHLSQAGIAVLAIIFIFTSVLSTVAAGLQAVHTTPPVAFIRGAQWLEENSPQDSLVLAPPEYGYMLQAVAKRPVYLNENYLAHENANELYEATQDILTSTRPGYLARQERVEYIVSDRLYSDSCLNTVYKEGIYIAKVLCR